MHKALFILLLALALTSCSHSCKSTGREWTVTLKDSIGTVHITLPLVYDTMHSWKCESDDAPDDEYYYRIQSSKSCMEEESGFLRRLPDTVYNFTLSHMVLFEGRHQEPFDPHKFLSRFLEREKELFNPLLKLGTDIDTASFVIDGLNYSLVWLPKQTTSKKKTNNQIHIATIFNHRFIRFTFEKTSTIPKDTAFIKESIEALKTVRFEK